MSPFFSRSKKKSQLAVEKGLDDQASGRTGLWTAGIGEKGYLEPMQFLAASGTSAGQQRDHNEDSLFTLATTLGGKGNGIPLGIFIIADGMGGHQHGEVASGIAIRTMARSLITHLETHLLNQREAMVEPVQDIVQAAIQEAQQAVTQTAPQSGTTLTAAVVLGNQMTIGHVGDSRAYMLEPGSKVTVLTRDHSLVKRLEELGQISVEEAATHPQRNVLYRAVGQGDALEADIFTMPFPQPGVLLICSDGLWGVLGDEKLSNLVASAPTLHSACQGLIRAANEAGGPDNISAVLVQLIG